MNLEESVRQYMERMFKPAWTTSAKNHWHPCCQEHPNAPLESNISGGGEHASEDAEVTLMSYKCPRGHEYEAPEPFVLTTPDLGCNSGPICVYCYVTWFHVNLGTEEFVTRG